MNNEHTPTPVQIQTARALDKAIKARRVLRAHANHIARLHAAQDGEPDIAAVQAIGRAAINAERAERAVLVAREAYFRAHPAA